MAKSSWPRLNCLRVHAAPMSGRPVAFDATYVVSPRGHHVAILDALPAASESERDDKDALRVRAYSHDGARWEQLLEHTPARTGYRFGDVRPGHAAVSDAGVVAFRLGEAVRVVRPGGGHQDIAAPGTFAFFDPIDPTRLRVIARRAEGERIETYDAGSGALLASTPVGNSGNIPPQVDPATGDVLLYDGWYSRDGAVTRHESDAIGEWLRVGHDALFLGAEPDSSRATERRAPDGSSKPVGAALRAWRRADPYRANAPMLTSVDGRSVLGRWNNTLTRFDAETLETVTVLPPPAPRHTSRGVGVLALLRDDLAIAGRSGLFLLDPGTGRARDEGPLALYGLALAGGRVVTLHEDGLRIDGAPPLALDADPAVDGLRVSPDDRLALVLGASEPFNALVVDLATGRELCRLPGVGSAAWIDAGHVIANVAGGLRVLDVDSGEVRGVGEVPPPSRVASDGRGRFFVATDVTLGERAPDGTVIQTFTAPKKLAGYTWPGEVVVRANEVVVVARKRVFRWDATGDCQRLTALENAVGGPKLDAKHYDGRLQGVCPSPDGRWLAVTAKTRSHALGVVLANRAGEVLGWTGPLFGRRAEWDERAWCVFRGDALVVATEHGAIAEYALPPYAPTDSAQ